MEENKINTPEETKPSTPKNKKKPFIIILVIILIVLAAVIGITSIMLLTNKDKEEEKKTTTKSTTTKEIVTIPVNNAKFHKENVALQPTSITINTEYASIKAVSISFNIINNTNRIIMPAFNELTINGKKIENTFIIVDVTAKSVDDVYGIPAYSECGAVLYFDKTDYDRLGIKEIETISLLFTVTDEQSWKKTPLFEKELITINSDEVSITTHEGYKENLLFNQNNVKISSLRASSNDVRYFVENNTDKKIEIVAEDVYLDNELSYGVNGEVKNFWSITLDPHKRVYSQLFTTEDYLYTSATIRSIKAKYVVYTIDDNGNKKELFRTKELTAKFD